MKNELSSIKKYNLAINFKTEHLYIAGPDINDIQIAKLKKTVPSKFMEA